MVSARLEELTDHPNSGTADDDDDRDDEHAGESEAPTREVDDRTEAPEEFEIDDEDELDRHKDDDAGDEENQMARAY